MTKVRSFSGFETSRPEDLLREVRQVLNGLSMLFIHDDPPELNGDASSGIYHILTASIRSLNEIEELVGECIGDPMTFGYRKGSEDAEKLYNKGFRQGYSKAAADGKTNAPDGKEP
jgi:hypothetical protein